MEVHRFKPVPQKGAGLFSYILTNVLLYVKDLRIGMNFFLHILALFSGKSLTFAKICPWKKRGTLKEGMMEKLMPRVDYWYANAGRTARGRSASEVVLQSLGINGGGILAGTELLSYDKQGIQTSIHPQTHSYRHGQSATVTHALRRLLHRPQGDGRRGGVPSGQRRPDGGQAAC